MLGRPCPTFPMPWITDETGRLHCTECRKFVAPGRSCECAATGAIEVVASFNAGEFERLSVEQRSLNIPLLTRAGIEAEMARRVIAADKEATNYRRAMKRVLKVGAVKLGPDGPCEADSERLAQGWGALCEQARNRADKAVRDLFGAVSDRERRAELERRERLVQEIEGRPRASTRGAA